MAAKLDPEAIDEVLRRNRATKTGKPTAVEGMPSTRIMRRNFFEASSTGSEEEALDFDAYFGCVSTLLNECAEPADMLVLRGGGGGGDSWDEHVHTAFCSMRSWMCLSFPPVQ